jgi:hypothetical protein
MSNTSIAKHTAGPWTRDKYGSLLGPDGRNVMLRGVSIAASGSMVAEAEKNTDLITAAPDLLEALNNILVGMEASGGWYDDDDLFDAGMRAYNKATGASK